MAISDPYLLVKSEVETSLQAASTLHSGFKRSLASSAASSPEELAWSRDELRGTLTALEGDLDELRQSIDIVARDPRFGVGEMEVEGRRAFVRRIRDEIQNMRRTVSPLDSQPSRPSSSSRFQSFHNSSNEDYPPAAPYRDDIAEDDEPGDGEDSDLNARYAHQQQSLLMESQDRLLDGISSTVNTLKNQAGVFGREILEQVGLVDDLEGQVDRSQGKLERANQRMKDFVRKNKNSGSSWTIILLTIVLSILLLAIILI